MSDERNDMAFYATALYAFMTFVFLFLLLLFAIAFDYAKFDSAHNYTNLEDYAKSIDRMSIMGIFGQFFIGISIGFAALMYYLKNNPKGFK